MVADAVAEVVEKRRRQRQKVSRRAYLQGERDELAGAALLLDLTDSGAFIVAEEAEVLPFAVGDRVQLIFRLSAGTTYEHVLARGVVRWLGFSSTHGRVGAGIEFDAPVAAINRLLAP